MAKVNSPRRYDSTLRKQQATETRARILDAAQRLFSDRGYAATTMEAIATEAAVATDTVYSSFRTKGGVLHKLLDVRVAGDDSPVPLLDRAGPLAVRAQPTQKRQLTAFAADIVRTVDRARPVDDIMRSAAAVDPEIAQLRVRMHTGRYENMRQLISWVVAKGPLRTGLDEEDAAAIVWTLAGPEVNRLLRVERGWSLERYETWLADTLTRTLLT